MKSYTFKVMLEKDKWPDEPEKKAIWRAYIPILPAAHAWGDTPKQALENLRSAVDLIIEDMLELGEPIPEGPKAHVKISKEGGQIFTFDLNSFQNRPKVGQGAGHIKNPA